MGGSRMRVSLLLQREAFAEVIEKTLARFLADRFGEKHKVRWHAKPLRVGKGQQVWYGNHFLNSFFVKDSEKCVLQPARNEFSHSPIPWRRCPQKFYVGLATSGLFRKIFTHSALTVTPSIPGARSMVLIPGSNKIRLLDFAQGHCFVIRKEGAPAECILNEIKIRQEYPFLPVPDLLKVSTKGDWFCERLVTGLPLNRIAERSKVQKIESELLSSLGVLWEKTLKNAEEDNYPERVFKDLREILSRNKISGSREKNLVIEGINFAENLISQRSAKTTAPLKTCLSHGDFQSSNVLCGEDRFWLIDWEFTSRRICSFDFLCWELQARRPSGLTGRVEKILRSPGLAARISQISGEDVDKTGRSAHLLLFLLEELLIRLQELSSPYILPPGSWFKEFLMEWKQSLAMMEKNGLP